MESETANARGDYVKRYLAVGLLLVSSQAAALLLNSQSVSVGCVPTMRAATIDQVKLAVTEASARLLQHLGALKQDLGRRAKAAPTEAADADAGKIAQELDSLNHIMQAVKGINNALGPASLLAAIREQMVYSADKVAVNARLSLLLFTARQEAEKAYQYVGPALTKITSSGVAVDVAKMRDAIEAVLKAVGNCTPAVQ